MPVTLAQFGRALDIARHSQKRGGATVVSKVATVSTCESCRRWGGTVRVMFPGRYHPDFTICIDCARDLRP